MKLEIRKQAVDQLVANTQSAEPRGVRKNEEGGRPDFDGMVRRRHAETEGRAEAKPTQPVRAEEKPEEPAESLPEQDAIAAAYAAAAAMLTQAQAEPRPAVVPAGAEAAEPALVTRVQADAPVQLAAMPQEAAPATEAAEQPAVQEAAAEAAPEIAVSFSEEPRRDNSPRPVITSEEKPAEERVPEPAERPAAEKADLRQTPKEPAEEQPEAAEKETVPERPREAPEARETPRESRVDARRAEAVRTERRPERGETEETDSVPQSAEAPVFETAEVPVKVAETPLRLEAPDAPEQLEAELADSLQVNDAQPNRVEITLTPEHLGRLTVEITRGENGALSVVLHPSTLRAANLLERSSDSLQSLLANRTGGEIEVRVQESDRQQMLNPDGQQRQQQQQQRDGENRGNRNRNPQEFLQQLRLGLVEMEG